MRHNMSTTDRIIRVIVAVIIIALFFSGVIPIPWGTTILMVSVVLILTSLINYCPLYPLLGIRRWEKKTSSSGKF
jgi:hypothetical protein